MKGSWPSPRTVLLAGPPASPLAGRLAVVALLGCGLSVAPLPGAVEEARADELPPLRALLLPTLAKGRGVGKPATWDGYLADRLTARGYAVDPRPPAAEDLKCQALDCLERLRKRAGADLALRVQVVDESLGFKLRLWLVRDGEAHRFDEQSECAQCSPEAARAQLDASLRKRLDEASAVPPTRGLEPQEPLPAPPVTPSPSPESSSPPGWLLGADIGFGAGLAVGAALAGVGLYALSRDGAPACDLAGPATQCPRVIDGGASAGVYLGIGGVLLVGSAVGLALVERRYRPRSSAPAAPASPAGTAASPVPSRPAPRPEAAGTTWLSPLIPLGPRGAAGLLVGGTF